MAKGDRNGCGVVDLSAQDECARRFADTPLGEVWGMGNASVAKLEAQGIATVADFVSLPAVSVRGLLTVTGQRTHAELQGVPCFGFNEGPQTRKSIACTRSFGRSVTEWEDMREAIASYTTRAAEKLRRHGLFACAMQVFMRTNEFNNDPKYSNTTTFVIEATADTLALIAAATTAARRLWRQGYRYAKGGVILLDLYRGEELPIGDLFAARDPGRSKTLMIALDAINGRFGRETVRAASVGYQRTWSMRRANLSPCYTTRIDEILKVNS